MATARGPLPSSSGGTELDRIRTTVTAFFPVYETRIGPQSLLLAVHADPATLEERFDRLRQELWTQGYIPLLRREHGEEFIEVVRRPKTGRTRLWINILLFLGTVATTSFAGALIWLTFRGSLTLTVGDFLYGELYFGAPVMTILGLHEFAHYVVARRRHLDASLPYFMPVPPPLILGTLGAFVSIREPFPDKKALFDVGAAGPLAGFAVAVPIALVGLYLSVHAPVQPVTYCGVTVLGTSYGSLLIGTPLFWYVFSLFLPAGLVNLHPLALAGWVGILVTAINLLPAGQLDGGHIFRALFGERARFVSYAAVFLLFALGLFYVGWIFFGILILFLGLRHPPPLNDISPLGTGRYLVGGLVAAILVTGFVVIPLSTPAGAVSLGATAIGPVAPLPPGELIGTDLNLSVNNQDPVLHGFLFGATVSNVTVAGPNGTTTNLNGSAAAIWATNASWTFRLPNGEEVQLRGGSVALPDSDYLTVNGMGTMTLSVSFVNSQAALGAGLTFSTNMFCAPPGGGSASTGLSVSFV
ncbi:MAG: site-2 protease family protein [Thermoplasmata archaeon]